MKRKSFISLSIILLIVNSGMIFFISLPDDLTPFNLSIGAGASFAGGNGTASNPYKISNVIQLQNVSSNLSAHYLIIDDIDASDTINWNSGKGFFPIGSIQDNFQGFLNGIGYKIIDLYINRPLEDYVGLFRDTNEKSHITNVTLINSVITGDDFVGTIVGRNYGNINNCSADGETLGNTILGGLIGLNRGTIINCNWNGNVTCGDNIDGFGNGGYGGLIGGNNGIVTNCIAIGIVNYINNEEMYHMEVGGLIGTNWEGTVTNCFASVNVSGEHRVGGLIGQNNMGEIIKCHSIGNVSGEFRVGGLVGDNDYGIISNSFYCIDYWEDKNNVFITPYGIYRKQYVDWINNNRSLDINDYLKFDSETGYYNISNVSNLKDILPFVPIEDYRYIQTADIDLILEPGYHIPMLQKGSFNGNGYAISNLNVTQKNNYNIGMFDYVGIDVLIENMELTEVNIEGIENIGGLVGFNKGNISKCTVSSNIHGGVSVGGLVGFNEGVVSDCQSSCRLRGNRWLGGLIGKNRGMITRCTSIVNIIGENYEIGGLVGYNILSKITQCSANGIVIGEDKIGGLIGYDYKGEISNCSTNVEVNGIEYIGGLIGYYHESIVSDCHSTSVVIGEDAVGGLIGYCFNRMVTRSYSTGRVEGNTDVGGLIGHNFADVVSMCYSSCEVIGYENVGGLMGQNRYCDLSNSYSTGSIYGGKSVGGFVGFNYYSKVIQSYSTGFVSGDVNCGGFIGRVYGSDSEVINCFWNNETSGQLTSMGGIGKKTTDMKITSIYVNSHWDFSGIWGIFSQKSYPYLLQIHYNNTVKIYDSYIEMAYEDMSYSNKFNVISSYPGCVDAFYNLSTNASKWLKINNNGKLSGLPSNDDVGLFWVNVTATLDRNKFDYKNFTLTVLNTNDRPIVSTLLIPDAVEDIFYSYMLNGTDIDPTDDILNWKIVTDANFLEIDSATGNLSGLPTNDDVGIWQINITLTDGNGGIDWKDFMLTVINVNDEPTLNETELNISIEEDFMGTEINLFNFIMDIDGDPITFNYSITKKLNVTINNGVVSIKPVENWFGWEIINFTANDGEYSVNIIVNVTVTPVNDAPYGAQIFAEESYIEGQDQIVYLTVSDPDLPYADSLSIVWTSNISGEIGVGNQINLSLLAGYHLITVTVTDLYGLSTTDSIEIEIIANETGEDPEDIEGNDDHVPLLLLILLVVAFLITALISYIWLRKRPDERQLEE